MVASSLPHLLILAISGRTLAQAARRAGHAPLVADFFRDRDTREAAACCARVEGDIAQGFSADAVMRALERLEHDAPTPPIGLVYGAGLEARPDLIAQIAKRWPVIGNDAATVSRVKDPRSFFGMLDNLGIAFPEVRFSSQSANMNGGETPLGPWLLKRTGGAGGSHIKPLDPRAAIPIHAYAQRRVDGRSISALMLSNVSGSRVLGFSDQWRAPALDRPYRYGGAAQPAEIAPVEAERMTEIAQSIGDAFALRGLGSIDFMLTENGPLVLEVNPRSGATLDIFDCDARPLLALHVAACEIKSGASCVPSPRRGEEQGEGGAISKFEKLRPLTPTPSPQGRGGSSPVGSAIEPKPYRACAAQIVFAPRDLTIPNDMTWPEWSADRPHDGETIAASRPVCTVCAEADTPAAARALAARRESAILESIQSPHRA